MSLSPYELVLIAGGFTVIGALIGGWIGYKNALGVYNISEFNKAAAIFRNAFCLDLIFLGHNARVAGTGSSNDLGEFLGAAYIHRHLKAIEIFRNYLNHEEKRGFDKACQEYCHRPDNPKELCFEQYSCKPDNTKTSETAMKKTALERIEKFLEFGKQK